MELTNKQTDITKGIAILFMMLLHIFPYRDYAALYEPLLFVGKTPLVFYISLFGDCCVAMFCFCSGYGLYIGYTKNTQGYLRKNYIRIFKLYVNYWIILLLFCIFIGLLIQKEGYPGSIMKFMINFLALDSTYNGAWWFFLIYIVLVLISGTVFKAIKKYNVYGILLFSFVVYVLTYYQRVKTPLVFDNLLLNVVVEKISLVGTSFLPFVAGAVFYEKKWFTAVNLFFERIKYRNLMALAMIGLLVVFHAFIQTMFVAVFTGIAFIVFFNMVKLNGILEKVLFFISGHSTNFWLSHMFFTFIFFQKLAYAPKYPLLIFIWIILLCLVTSYIVKAIYNPLLQIIDKRTVQKK